MSPLHSCKSLATDANSNQYGEIMKKRNQILNYNPNRLLNVAEAADYLGITAQHLRCSSMANPTWPGPRFVRLSKRCVKYRVRHLDEFIAARVVDPADRFVAA